MRRLLLSLLFLFLILNVFAQQVKVTWGDEFKLRKTSTDLEVICADKSGVFLQESHAVLKSYFLIGATMRLSATLVKMDANLSEVYRNDFNKELKGKEFEKFYNLQGRIFILATDYNKKAKQLTLYGAEINKETGGLSGDWQEMENWQKEEKNDDMDLDISPNSDSSKMVVVLTVQGKEKNTYQVEEFDKNLKSTGKATSITNEFDAKTYKLENTLFTSNNKIILVGRVYEYEDGKKKKDKFLDFKNYNIRIYNVDGKMQKEINTDIQGKWLVGTAVSQLKDKPLVLAAFYSNEKKGKAINGLLIQRIDPNTGDVLTTNQKEINTSLITAVVNDSTSDDDDKESKKDKKEKENFDRITNQGEGFSKAMKFKDIIYTPDNGIVILSEVYNEYTYTTSSYMPGSFGNAGTWTYVTHYVYEHGDIMMSKVDDKGNILWLQVLPKFQQEIDWSGYGGFGVITAKDKIDILFNDNKNNNKVLQLGQKVKVANRFNKTNCDMISLDYKTGKYTRSTLFDNADQPVAMPASGVVIGDEMYIVGKQNKGLGKPKVAVAKITVQ